MNAPLSSRALVNPFAQIVTPTLEDVIRQITRSILTATRKRDYLSACRRVGALLGSSLDSLPADPKVLRERFDTISPVLARLSPKNSS